MVNAGIRQNQSMEKTQKDLFGIVDCLFFRGDCSFSGAEVMCLVAYSSKKIFFMVVLYRNFSVDQAGKLVSLVFQEKNATVNQGKKSVLLQ